MAMGIRLQKLQLFDKDKSCDKTALSSRNCTICQSDFFFLLPYHAAPVEKARRSPVVLMTCSDFSGFVMDNHLNRHTYGFIQSRLVPFYLHLGSACAFFNLTIYAVYHPSDLLDDREAFQVCCFVPHQHIG